MDSQTINGKNEVDILGQKNKELTNTITGLLNELNRFENNFFLNKEFKASKTPKQVYKFNKATKIIEASNI